MKTLRPMAVLPLAGALAAGPLMAGPALAHGAGQHGQAHVHARSHRPATRPFAVVGTVAAIDASAGTVTVDATAGSRDLRGTAVAAAVTGATKIRFEDRRVSLADLPAGATVTMVGTRTGGGLTARLVNAHAPDEVDSTSI